MPYRSLTRRGVVFVGAALIAISLVVGVRCWFLGAWPVTAFSLLEIPLAVVLLVINIRRARASESILLDHAAITVTRTDPAGRRDSFSLPAAWLRVALEENAGGSRVMISSHGREREIGAFLHQPDKASLAEALKHAIHQARNPRFDNPQLLEC